MDTLPLEVRVKIMDHIDDWNSFLRCRLVSKDFKTAADLRRYNPGQTQRCLNPNRAIGARGWQNIPASSWTFYVPELN